MRTKLCFALIWVTAALGFSVNAQTSMFTYQGSLTDGATAANGTFQMQFKLFDSISGGAQVGSTVTNSNVTVTQGTFTVQLDFGAGSFPGADRFLEIAVRHNSGESYTTLSPRQQVASSPYTIRTLSAGTADLALDSQKLGGIAANQFVQTTDARLSDARNPLPGSPNYIQNTAALQIATQNITGNGYFGGNVGIGTTTPASKVEIVAQDGLRVTGFQPFLTLRDGSTNAFIQNVGGNLYMLGSNVSQNPDKTGLVKFGILVNADGSLNLCFNAQNPTSCGVTVSHPSAGVYDLTFPVQINSRIFSATMVLTSNFSFDIADHIYVRPTSSQVLRVRTAVYGQVQGDFDTGFYLIVI